MRFWDTSAIVPLLLEQPASGRARELLAEDPAMAAWWGTPIECWSAAARLRREGRLSAQDEAAVHALLEHLHDAWVEVLPSEEVRKRALRLLQIHALRSADAVQLAAALTCAGSPGGAGFVAFDERLRGAARVEGLEVY